MFLLIKQIYCNKYKKKQNKEELSSSHYSHRWTRGIVVPFSVLVYICIAPILENHFRLGSSTPTFQKVQVICYCENERICWDQ